MIELAGFIQTNEPEIKGFSDKNIWRMKQFYETYKDFPKLSPLVREISWTNNLLIFSRCKTIEEMEFYLKYVKQENYSKRELNRQISASLFERSGNELLIPWFVSPQTKIIPLVLTDTEKALFCISNLKGLSTKTTKFELEKENKPNSFVRLDSN